MNFYWTIHHFQCSIKVVSCVRLKPETDNFTFTLKQFPHLSKGNYKILEL